MRFSVHTEVMVVSSCCIGAFRKGFFMQPVYAVVALICVDLARGALHVRCGLLWRAPHFGAFARAGTADKMMSAGAALGPVCPAKATLLAWPARSEKCH